MGVNIGTIQTNCRKPAHNEPDADSRASADHGTEQLMIRYQQADPVATAALVNLVSPQLYRFFASRTNRAGAEEMLQDAWRRIHRSRHSYRPGEPMLPWLYAIARSVRADSCRQRHRISSPETGVDVLYAPSTQTDDASNRTPFEEFVGELPKGQREVVTLLRVTGLSIEEVARATSSTEWAVKQRVHRAYQRLREFLRARRHGGEPSC